jgi:glycosyltransferase involved in cell wall biosynthesis
MRILLVGNYALDNQASMSRYAEMLSRDLNERGHMVEVLRPGVVFGGIVGQPTLRKWLGYIDKYILFPVKLRARVRGFDLVHVCDHSNAMYLAHTGGLPSSVTCHDLLAIGSALGRYPQQAVGWAGKVQQRWIRGHLVETNNVVCVSANTARELAMLSGSRVGKAVVIPNALEQDCGPASAENVERLRARLGIRAGVEYLLHVGGNHWYKNRVGVLRIFKGVRERLGDDGQRLRLVMAGAEFTPEMREYAAAELPAGTVIEVVDAPDEDLWSLYTGAQALLFPSLHEGFGWPLIEAQRCGCAVITSNRAPMTEVAGAGAVYIDPEDEAKAAEVVVESLAKLVEMRERGFGNVKRFDPAVVLPEYEGFFAGMLRTRRRSDTRG